MNRAELDMLATYNAEEARGIVHAEAWQIRMMELQARYQREWGNMRQALGLEDVKGLGKE